MDELEAIAMPLALQRAGLRRRFAASADGARFGCAAPPAWRTGNAGCTAVAHPCAAPRAGGAAAASGPYQPRSSFRSGSGTSPTASRVSCASRSSHEQNALISGRCPLRGPTSIQYTSGESSR